MMAISRNPNEFAFVHALEASEPRKLLSPVNITAISIALVLHIALIAFIYELHFKTPVVEPIASPTMIVLTQRWTPPPVVPPKSSTALPPAERHISPTIDLSQQVSPSPVIPEPPKIAQVDVPTTAPARTPPVVITNPQWLSQPNSDQMANFYPAKALDDGVSGRAALTCMVTVTGAPTACQVTSETPPHAGFGQAALKLAPYFRMSPRLENGRPVDGSLVVIPIAFNTSE